MGILARINRIYPAELQLKNKANSSDTEAPVLELNLSISNGTVSTQIYNKRNDFDLDLSVNFPFVDEWRRPSTYIIWCLPISAYLFLT